MGTKMHYFFKFEDFCCHRIQAQICFRLALNRCCEKAILCECVLFGLTVSEVNFSLYFKQRGETCLLFF